MNECYEIDFGTFVAMVTVGKALRKVLRRSTHCLMFNEEKLGKTDSNPLMFIFVSSNKLCRIDVRMENFSEILSPFYKDDWKEQNRISQYVKVK